MKTPPTLLILVACSLTACVRVNISDAIANIGKQEEALIVPRDPKKWKFYRANGTQYIETKRVVVSPDVPVTIEDSSFSQLPHRNFNIDKVIQEPYYYAPESGQKLSALPAHAEPEPKPGKLQHIYPWYTVGSEHQPIALNSPAPSPHRYWTAPLSALTFVTIDIPASIALTAISLPINICYSLTMQHQQMATIDAVHDASGQQTKQISGKCPTTKNLPKPPAE